jgi:hypothetical protein
VKWPDFKVASRYTKSEILSAKVVKEIDFSRDGVDYTHVIDLYEEYNPRISTRKPQN